MTRIENLRSLIGSGPEGEKVMDAVKGSIWDQMLRGAIKDGEDFNPNALKRAFYGLPDGVRKALWREELPEMEKLLTNLSKDPQAGMRRALQAGAGIVTGLGVYRAYHSHDPLTVLVGAAGLHFAPKLMANPDVLRAVSGFVEQRTQGASKQAMAAAANQVTTAVHAAQRAEAEAADNSNQEH